MKNVILGTPKIRASYQNDCADPKTDAFTYLTDVSPKLTFISSEFSTVSVYTASQDDAQANDCTVFPADQTAAEGVMISGTAAGISTSGFVSWTWAGVNERL